MGDAASSVASSTEQTHPPKRRRRWPWTLLAVALVPGAGLGWWYWPRGDARFVGQWVVSFRNDARARGELKLMRHGMGRWEEAGRPHGVSLLWRIEGDQLVLGRGAENSEDRRAARIAYLVLQWTGQAYMTGRTSYRFSIVDPNEIRLDDDEPTAGKLRRIE